MFDIGWTELLVIGIVALVVVGPKDLPVMFKTFGRFTAKARAMAREFQRAMEQAADEAGIKDAANDLKKASGGLDTLKDAAAKFEKWDPKRAAKTAVKSAAAAAVATPAAADPAAAEGPSVESPASAPAAPDASKAPE